MATKPKTDTGAPANALLLESHAADAEREVVRVKERLGALRALLQPNSDSDEQKSLNVQIGQLQKELEGAYDLWFKLSKQVREYDKAVSEQRRDGEKILRSEVERLLTQAWRFQRIARRSFIVSIAQDAILCKNEEDFYTKYSQAIEDCEVAKLLEGIEHEKFPPFVLECYKKSL